MSYLRTSNAKERVNKIPQSTSVAKNYCLLSTDEFELSERGISLTEKEKVWKKIQDYFMSYKSTFIGYQVSESLQVSETVEEYLDIHINNAGDPFNRGDVGVNTKFLECAVLDYFAKLWNISVPKSADARVSGEAYWGYIVSMGCTEANLYAMYNARDYLSGWPLLNNNHSCDKDKQPPIENGFHDKDQGPAANAFTPVVFYSEEAHYGHPKAMRILQIKTFHELGSGHFSCPLTYPDDYPSNYLEEFLDSNGWPSAVPVDSDGSMYLPSLVKLVDSFVSRGYPPIVTFTIGTTFRGSYDHSQAAISSLLPILKRNKLYKRRVHYDPKDPTKFDVRHGFWFHVDGALGAAYLPFLEMATNQALIDNQFPNGFPVFDFRIPEVMSISVSFHKWFGSPFPTGIFMTRKNNQLQPPTNPLYVNSGDTTFSGSRNGHAAMIMWDFLSTNSHQDLIERAVRNVETVRFTLKKFKELEQEIGQDLWVSHVPGSLIVCFKRPNKDIVRKYSLCGNTIKIKTSHGKETRLYSHLCLMEHVNEELIEKFIEDLREGGAFPPQSTLEANHPPSLIFNGNVPCHSSSFTSSRNGFIVAASNNTHHD